MVVTWCLLRRLCISCWMLCRNASGLIFSEMPWRVRGIFRGKSELTVMFLVCYTGNKFKEVK